MTEIEARNIIDSKSHVIFDFDGTLAKLQIDWRSWHFGVGDIFRLFDPAFSADNEGKMIHGYQESYFREFGQACRDKVAAFNAEFEKDNTTACTPNDKAIAYLQSLKHKKIYVWSNNSRETVMRLLSELGVISLCSQVVTRDDVFFVKPDPEGFGKIFDPSVKRDDYVLIGDSAVDQKAAQNSLIDSLLPRCLHR